MNEDCCPLCGTTYYKSQDGRRRSAHHVYIKHWYRDSNLLVYICENCHKQFNLLYKHDVNQKRWSKFRCIINWFSFTARYGKNAYEIWPELKDEFDFNLKNAKQND